MGSEAGSRLPGDHRPRVAYVMSRFPKLSETFVLDEMRAVEAQGVRVEVYPLQIERPAKMHPEAGPWLGRAHRAPLFSWPILASNLAWLARQPWRYLGTLALLLWHTRGSARYCAGGLAFFPKAVWFADRMSAEGVGHVHAHFASHPAAVAWVIRRLSGIPYSFTAHGSDLHRDRRMLRQKVSAATFVVAISRFNQRIILESCGSDASGKVAVIHCGVDLGVFRPDGRASGRNGQAPVVLCIGTLHEVKGQRHLIEACRRLAARGIPFACRLAGDGPDRERLARQVERAGLLDRVSFLGALTHDEVRDALRQADVVAVPSVPTRDGRREGIPVALMEAMACGVPVVGSRLSGIPEVVEDAETGLLVEPGDPAALADALERLLRDRELARRLASSGRATIEREFDLRSNAARLADRFRAGAGR